MKKLLFIGIITGTMLSSTAFAQTTTSGDPAPIPGHGWISKDEQRLENQTDRIDAGIKDGQISKGQAIADENRDASIQNQIATDEAKNGGHLTKKEQKQITGELNHNSGKIHKQRHPWIAKDHKRLENQRDRIAEGVKDGELTKKQATRDYRADRHIGREIRHDKMENGGHLTGAEQRQITRQENRNSARIAHQERRNKKG